MRRVETRAMFLAAWVLAAVVAVPPVVTAEETIGTPQVSGDQLFYFYDAREDRVPFLTVANPADESVFLDVVLYSEDLRDVLAADTISLVPAANLVIDPGSFGEGGAAGRAGLAVITPVVGLDDPTPVVPPQPIVGGFTLANLRLMAGFGQNPFSRFAVEGDGDPADPGRIVDGNAVVYERFDPGVLMIPTYFNPADLAPAVDDGNRIFLAAFDDEYPDGGAYTLSPRAPVARASFFNAAGIPVSVSDVTVNGLLFSDLQAIAGAAAIDGSSGKAFFSIDAGEGNVFGLFSQTLGTFSVGQRMPAVAGVPTGLGPVEPITIAFEARVGAEPFACGRTYANVGTTDATIEPSDGRLYLENVRLVLADGGEVKVRLEQDGLWQYRDVALLDFEDGEGLCGDRGSQPTNTQIRGEIPAAPYRRIRFEVGVTEALNHGDVSTAPSPLSVSALYWNWNAGYKFLRYDNTVESTGETFNVHLGSTGCTGDGRGQATCANSNRIEVDLPFDPGANRVIVDLGALIADSDLTSVTPETPPGCQSAPGDPECVAVFAAAGLSYGDNPGGLQRVFFVE